MTTPILAVSDLSAGYGDAPVIRRLGVTVEPGEVAAMLAWVCGPASAAVTGAVLPVDAGMTAS